MADIRIDALSLRLSGGDRRAATRLARAMVARLCDTPFGDGWAEPGNDVAVRISARPGTTPERLAEQAVSELIRKLRRV